MLLAKDLQPKELKKVASTIHTKENHGKDYNQDDRPIRLRFGCGTPYPSTPRSERQYNG